MASRFRLTSDATAPAVSPTGGTYSHDQGTRRKLLLTDTSTLTTEAYTPDAADHLVAGDARHVQFVSNPLTAGAVFTSGDTLKFCIQGTEAHANNNLRALASVYVYDSAGTTLRATLRSIGSTGSGELAGTLTSRFFSTTLSGSYTLVADDRLVVDFYVTGTPAASGGVQGHNGSLRWGSGGAAGDLLENDTETGTTRDPWIEFATTVTEAAGGTQDLAGSLFTNPPSFFTGVVTAIRDLAGVLYAHSSSFFTGTVALSSLTGVDPRTLLLTEDNPYIEAAGLIITENGAWPFEASAPGLTGTLFANNPTFFIGELINAQPLTGILFVNSPAFFVGEVIVTLQNLTGTLFTNPPTFFTGVVSSVYSLAGALYANPPIFFTGSVAIEASLFNTFEGGSDGTAITTANSGGGSGDAFDTVTISGTGTVVFDDDAGVASGTFAALASTTSAAAASAYMRWGATWQAETEVWTRFYFRTNDPTPTTNHDILRLEDGASVAATLQLRTGGVLGLRDSSSTLRYSSTTVLAADTLYRIEVHVVHSATVGHLEARLFHGANLHGTTADETFGNLTDNWNTLTQSDEVWYGIGSTPGQAINHWFDELAIGNSDWIGPADSVADLTGTLFVNTPAFPTGAVTSIRDLAGVLFTDPSSFFMGSVTTVGDLAGTLFSNSPTFNVGVVTTGAVDLAGTLYANPTTFFAGTITSVGDLAGVLYTNPPSFFVGTVTSVGSLTGVLYVNPSSFFAGTVASAWDLAGTLYENPPVFESGTVTTGYELAGALYENPSVFFQGAITGGALVLNGALFVNDPVFLQGEIVGFDRVYPFWPATTDDGWPTDREDDGWQAAVDDGWPSSDDGEWPVVSELEWQGV